MNQNYYYIAQYNCNAYGSSDYGVCATSTTSSADSLANTGYDFIVPVALGMALVIAGAILLIKRAMRRVHQKNK